MFKVALQYWGYALNANYELESELRDRVVVENIPTLIQALGIAKAMNEDPWKMEDLYIVLKEDGSHVKKVQDGDLVLDI